MEQQSQVLTVSWQALTAIVGVLVIVVGMATGYLKLFMQTKLAELEKNLMQQIKREFQDKELSMKTEKDFESRIARLEGKVFQGA